MAVIDLEGVFQRANARVLAMLGMTREQFQPVSCRSLTHPDEQAHIAEDFQALLQGQLTSVEGERPYDLADGRALWVRRSAALVRDPAGQPLYFLVQVQDVTAEREALTELRRLAYTDDLPGLGNREQLRVTVDSRGTGCAVLLVDPDDFGRINDSFGRAPATPSWSRSAVGSAGCAARGTWLSGWAATSSRSCSATRTT